MNRWADGRQAWQTAFNCCTSLGAQTSPLLKDEVASELFLMQLMAFAMSLKAYLRDEKVTKEECGERMDWAYMRKLNASACPPMQALKALSVTSREEVPEDSKLASAIFDEVSEQIRVINHAFGTMRLIKTTPMTKGYVTTLRSFLILWLGTLPMGVIGKFGWLATPVIAFIAFLFINVEKMAVEIEQPFGDDPNDLPQERYLMDLQEVLVEFLPSYEPEIEKDEKDEEDEEQALQNQKLLSPMFPPNLPPGRYYMDVPPNSAPPYLHSAYSYPGMGPSPSWREQLRARMGIPEMIPAPNGTGRRPRATR
jgi:putative membrane protein